MTDKRHHDQRQPKVTTTQQDSGSLCTCAYRTQRSNCIRDELDGGREHAFVRGERHSGVRRGSGKVRSSSDNAAVVRQLQNDPHNNELMRDERRFATMDQARFNGALFPTPSRLSSVKRRNTTSAHVHFNPISRDALLPYIARNLLLAKLASCFGNTPITNYNIEAKTEINKMDMLVSHKKHRTRTEEDESQRKHRHHHRQHRNGHKSDGELEKERMRAKLRGGEKEKSTDTHMERSSSDQGKVKERLSERARRVETDEEREERRRRRRERKEAETYGTAVARSETDPTISDSKKEHRSHKHETETERRSSRKESRYESDREGKLSSRSDKDKQIVLARKEKESSNVSTRQTLRPNVSSSSRRAESKQRAKETEKGNEHAKSREKEKDKEPMKDNTKNGFLGFVLEKKDRMVKCVSCLSDDIPKHQAAKLTACGHFFCNECLKHLFTLSLTDPALMPPKCCTAEHIPLKHVDRLLSYQTKKQWNKKYNEYTSSNRIYCPTKDCGHWISPKHIAGKIGQCSRCKTRVCTTCNGKAHGSSECPEDEDLKAFIKTAKENGYQKCYDCRAVVELKSGCNHITCRCTAEFCYRCGEKWKTCDCPWFAYPDSEEEDDEQEDHVAPPRVEDEEEARRERRRREREEFERRAERERREREAQIAEDEALAKRLAQASLFLDKETLGKFDGNASLRTGLRNSYKRLAEEYAEASKRDEEAREERVKEKLQKLRDRDEALRSARRGSTSSSHREPRSPTARHERRHSEPKPLTSRGSHSRPQTAQPIPSSPLTRDSQEDETAQRRLFDDERAARIAKYIMGELDELDDEPTVKLPSPVEKSSGSASPPHRSHPERSRRGTTSGVSTRPSSSRRAEHAIEGKSRHHQQTSPASSSSVSPRTLPRLETPSYAASSVLADVAFPLENEKPSRRSSSHTRTGKIRDIYLNNNTKSAPTSPMRPTANSVIDSGSARKNYLADLGYKFLKHQQQVPAPHSAYPLNYTSASAPAPAYTTYTYSSHSGFGAGPGERSRARQFTQNWGGIEAMGSTWKEPFVDRLELSSHAPRVGIPRTSTY